MKQIPIPSSILCLALIIFTLLQTGTQAQEANSDFPKPTVKLHPFDGTIIVGYVDNGAFLNFTGPNITLTCKQSKIILGMLPSLRYKEDKSTFKNAPVTPNLGIGLTYCRKKLAMQIPVYYNTKTATTNGRWNIGIGIGIRLK